MAPTKALHIEVLGSPLHLLVQGLAIKQDIKGLNQGLVANGDLIKNFLGMGLIEEGVTAAILVGHFSISLIGWEPFPS
jgi:hypothetical protein